MKVTLNQLSPNFCFDLLDENGMSVYFAQFDWEHAELAELLGWGHPETSHSEQLAAAFDFLAENAGKEFEVNQPLPSRFKN